MMSKHDEEEHYSPFKKCVSHTPDDNFLNLIDYLVGADNPEIRALFEENLKWKSGATVMQGHELNFVQEPAENKVRPYYISVMKKDSNVVLDRIIITVIPKSTRDNFNAWYNRESSDKGWTAELPFVYEALEAPYSIQVPVDGNGGGTETVWLEHDPDRNCTNNYWKKPHPTDTYYHPGASYEVRSERTPGGHGHQACYDEDRNIIRSGVSAGSADREWPFSFPSNPWFWKHVDADVTPFVWAAQMDGNPVEADGTTMTTLILHEGVYLKRYFEARPAHAEVTVPMGGCR